MTTLPSWPDALRWQAHACRALGSEFSARLLEAGADEALGDLGDLFAAWADEPLEGHIRDATQLRLLGALHHLTLTRAAPSLAAEYPQARPETDWPTLIEAARQALSDHRAEVAAFMASPPQTNEVARSLCLAPGFLMAAAETGLPVRLFEIGASAGLNLRWDQFSYDFGGRAWGDAASPVPLEGDWRGGPPGATQPVEVLERCGCDHAPIDPLDEAQALRLQAYVWPDQSRRLARLTGALAVARQVPAPVDRADAADWVNRRVAPVEGALTVLFHSVMWQYMPQRTQKTVSAAILAAGAAATKTAPFAWLRMEPDSSREGFPMALWLTIWPDGRERHLADVHPHGAWVKWLAG
jgi:hypothetical protein